MTAERQQARCRVCDREIPLSTAASGEHKSVSDIFRENGYPPMDNERRARVEATRLEGLQRDDTAAREVMPENAATAMHVVATKGRHEASVWRDEYGEWVWTCDCSPEIYGGYAREANATREAKWHVDEA